MSPTEKPPGLLPARHAGPLLAAAVLCWSFLVLFALWQWRHGPNALDLGQHYTAGLAWSRGDQSVLYRDFAFGHYEPDLKGDPSRGVDRFNYVYSPLVAWAASGFVSLPLGVWMAAWTVLSLAAFIAACRIWREALAPPPGAWLFAAGAPSLAFALYTFQNTTLTLLILASASLLFQRGALWSGGLLLSCQFYRPTLLPWCLVLLVLTGHWRAAAGLACGLAVWMGGSLAVGGWELNADWLGALRTMSAGEQVQPFEGNISWRGFLCSVWGTGPTDWIQPLVLGAGAATLAALGIRWWLLRRPRPEPLTALWMAVGIWALLSPYVAHYDWLLTLPLIGLAARWPLAGRAFAWWACGAAALSGFFTGISIVAPLATLWLIREWAATTAHQRSASGSRTR